jgi:hypothetical protein
MQKPFLETRNDAYLWILKFGLQHIRDLSYKGQSALAEIEADHLHNIPGYIDEPSEQQHEYYLLKEVPLYLSKLLKHDYEHKDNARKWYVDGWDVLRAYLDKNCG